MESILNFLANNYLWFLLAAVVLGIALIAFIIVSKRKGKSEPEVNNPESVAPVEAINPAEMPEKPTPPIESISPEVNQPEPLEAIQPTPEPATPIETSPLGAQTESGTIDFSTPINEPEQPVNPVPPVEPIKPIEPTPVASATQPIGMETVTPAANPVPPVEPIKPVEPTPVIPTPVSPIEPTAPVSPAGPQPAPQQEMQRPQSVSTAPQNSGFTDFSNPTQNVANAANTMNPTMNNSVQTPNPSANVQQNPQTTINPTETLNFGNDNNKM